MGSCLPVPCLRTLVCHLSSDTLPVTTLFMNRKGAENHLESSSVSGETLCENTSVMLETPNVCPGAGTAALAIFLRVQNISRAIVQSGLLIVSDGTCEYGH